MEHGGRLPPNFALTMYYLPVYPPYSDYNYGLWSRARWRLQGLTAEGGGCGGYNAWPDSLAYPASLYSVQGRQNMDFYAHVYSFCLHVHRVCTGYSGFNNLIMLTLGWLQNDTIRHIIRHCSLFLSKFLVHLASKFPNRGNTVRPLLKQFNRGMLNMEF